MKDKRKLTRADARRLRALAKDEARQKAGLTHERMLNAVRKARSIIVDQNFTDTLRSQGVQSLPQSLVTEVNPNRRGGDLEFGSECPYDHSLEFMIAWTFFFPLFANPVIAAHLDKSWPGFTIQLKDAFISLVIDGALPQQTG